MVKIVQSSTSPLKVTAYWPTFEIPTEDARCYIRPDPEFYMGCLSSTLPLEVHLQVGPRYADKSIPEASASSGSLFSEIRFQQIQDRIEKKGRRGKLSRNLAVDFFPSDCLILVLERMLSVMFKAPEGKFTPLYAKPWLALTFW